MIIFITTLFLVATLSAAANDAKVPDNECELPPYPEHGTYNITGHPNAHPGDSFDWFLLDYSCDKGYKVKGDPGVFCINGRWSDKLPVCDRECKLNEEPSVEFKCLHENGFRKCNENEFNGTVVQPECKRGYYSPSPLPLMKCIEGIWDYIPICQQDCGRVPEILDLDLNREQQRNMPWVALVYKKTHEPPNQICIATLVTTNVVISGAHCFWSDKNGVGPSSNFLVAVGKSHRSLSDPKDDGQRSDVASIQVPSRFRGRVNNYESDIAIVTVKTPFKYNMRVLPVCLDFDNEFEKHQLQPGSIGKMATIDKKENFIKTISMPYVDTTECINKTPARGRELINFDKICAGDFNANDTTSSDVVCLGDGGTGFYVPDIVHGVPRYYFRGILSVAVPAGNLCYSIVFLTKISHHEDFIKSKLI